MAEAGAWLAAWAPWSHLGLFLAASGLLVWRLEEMGGRGLEGTVLGTLVMPYCSGLGNLLFVWVLLSRRGEGGELVVNAAVNNVTNLTLLVGLPALIWGLDLVPVGKGKKKDQLGARLGRLSVLLSLAAGAFFTAAVWALGADGTLGFGDGLVLVLCFAFWQVLQVFDVLKSNLQKSKGLDAWLAVDFALVLTAGFGLYVGLDGLVRWLEKADFGFINADNLGWLSGWLMVLPNAFLAFYYGWKKKPEVVYASQLGDGHICIPLALGVFALCAPIKMPTLWTTALLYLAGTLLAHLLFLVFARGLPRWAGAIAVAAYGAFLWQGLA